MRESHSHIGMNLVVSRRAAIHTLNIHVHTHNARCYWEMDMPLPNCADGGPTPIPLAVVS